MPVIEKITNECGVEARFIGTLFGHTLKNLEGKQPWTNGFSYNKIYGMMRFIRDKNLTREIALPLLPLIYEHPNIEFESALAVIGYQSKSANEILDMLPILRNKFEEIKSSKNPQASRHWIMGQLRNSAIGNLALADLFERVDKGLGND